MAEFEKSRLTLALKMRGMTQRDLASHLSISSQFISMIERDIKPPPDNTLRRIAEVLNFPVEFFFGYPIDAISEEQVSFRARRKMKASDRDKGLAASDAATTVITLDLLSRFRLPRIDVPDLSMHKPEEAALLLRMQWALGSEPIQNMVHLLESRGVLVYWLDVDSESLDAFSLWRDERPFVFLNSLKEAGDRGRFDAAHELGHLVLHQHISDLKAEDPNKDLENLNDSDIDVYQEQKADGEDVKKDIEAEANRFASAFLLPQDRFRSVCPDVPDFEKLYRLKAQWKVSIAAMIMRGCDLGIFSEWQKRLAFKRLNATGMRTKERVPVQREQSKLHPIIRDALQGQGISSIKYASLLHLYPADLFKLMPSFASDTAGDAGKIIKLASRRPLDSSNTRSIDHVNNLLSPGKLSSDDRATRRD